LAGSGPFAEIGGVPYLRCRHCLSVFVPVSPDVPARYQGSKELVAFRKSAAFQRISAERRGKIWDETLFWLEFRIARYLGKKSGGFRIFDIENIFGGWRDMVRNASFCGSYVSRSEVLGNAGTGENGEKHEVVLYLDKLRHEAAPGRVLQEISGSLAENGLLIVSTRVSSGFDILTLRGNNSTIYPYECVLLPSLSGIQTLLEKNGFEVLELFTPGTQDVNYVLENKAKAEIKDLFIDYLLNNAGQSALREFQYFLQKNGLSSHARIVARKVGEVMEDKK
jgi:hypothetical protein